MSVTAAQAQADLDALTATVTTVIPQAIKLITDLAAANATGVQLDPAKVEADVAAMSQQLTDLQTKLTGTPDPAAPAAPAAPSA